MTPIATLMRSIIVEAGNLLLDRFNNSEIFTKDSEYNLVTEADLLSEKLITEAIRSHFPDHAIIGEESGATPPLDSPHLWIIDPLDGTSNYASGMPHFCVSIAYAERGEVQVGAIYDPIRKELFFAERGKGATMNDKPITVSRRNRLAESLVCTGFYYDRGELMEKTVDMIKTLFHHGIRCIRRTGSAALDLCWVASGRFDGYFEYQLSLWDYAAGWLILSESGGTISDRDGSTFSLASIGVISASNTTFDELVSVVKWNDSIQ